MRLRKASLSDIGAIKALINGYAAQGIMLPRTDLELAEHIRDFTLAVDAAGALLGCGALHIYTPTVAEVRSLAVAPEVKTKGIGRAVVAALLEEGREFGLSGIFAFTYVPEFFGKLGFAEVDRGALPLKAWKDCLRCPKFQACDEIAVLNTLRNTPLQGEQTRADGETYFPILRVDR
jgi:amino-acid N-acetyltransferase